MVLGLGSAPRRRRRVFRLLAGGLLAWLGLGAACGGVEPLGASDVDGGSDVGGEVAPLAPEGSSDAPRDVSDAALGDAAAPDAPVSDGATPRCPARALSGSLESFVAAAVAAMRASAGAGSGAYAPPSAAERDAFAAIVLAALAGDEVRACDLPPSYRLAELADPTFGAVRVVAELDALGAHAPSLYYGLYARRVDLSATRALVLEAPHPLFDANTADEAQDLFLTGYARYLLVAGAHRCAAVDPSPCSGTTTACGARAAYRESDAAHATSHPFWAIHREISKDPALLFLQLHGNGASCPAALLSDLSGVWPATGWVRAFGDGLASAGVDLGLCGAGFPVSGCDLCGGANVEGRETAGSPNACTAEGPNAGRFAHLEQLLSLRRRGAGGAPSWGPILAALEASLPR